jgi:hypothetical protein
VGEVSFQGQIERPRFQNVGFVGIQRAEVLHRINDGFDLAVLLLSAGFKTRK